MRRRDLAVAFAIALALAVGFVVGDRRKRQFDGSFAPGTTVRFEQPEQVGFKGKRAYTTIEILPETEINSNDAYWVLVISNSAGSSSFKARTRDIYRRGPLD